MSGTRSLALTPLSSPFLVNPPTNLSGIQQKNNFGSVYELVNSISWSASSSSVSGYRVYRNGVLIATLNSSTYGYDDHNIQKGVATLYSVRAYNSLGNQSSAVDITIR